MKLFKTLGLALLMLLICVNEASAESWRRRGRALAVCPKIISVNSGFIYKNSAPIRSGGVGTPIVGFRKEPTLIMARTRLGSRGGTTIYDSRGTKIGSCPWASAHDTLNGRYRCTMQTSSLRRAAVRNTRKAEILFKITGNTCVSVPDAGRCYGSVKGLCNQLIS